MLMVVAVGVVVRFRVDQYFHPWKFASEIVFNLVHDRMNLAQCHVRIEPDMELDEIMHPARPGADIVNRIHFGVAVSDG